MEEIELIKNFEKISLMFPNRLLKLQGYVLTEKTREFLEVIIYKGFSSSTTHPIEIDVEKKVINYDHIFTKFVLCKAPLTQDSEKIIRENENSLFFQDQKNWI